MTVPWGTVAIGLKDDAGAAFADGDGDGFVDFVDGGGWSVAQSEDELGGVARAGGGQHADEGGVFAVDADAVAGGRDVDLLAAGHLDGEEHEGHELEDDIDHGGHVDVFVTFVGDLAAEEHGAAWRMTGDGFRFRLSCLRKVREGTSWILKRPKKSN